jgi:dTDP-4-dehydrorhamnose reductase
MTSLIIGASGQVGRLLFESSAEAENCVGTYCQHPAPGLHRLDLRETAAVEQLVQDLRPTTCYLAGAMTFVDYAESHPEECRAVNVKGTTTLAQALAEVGGVLVLFSTEHVFDSSPASRREDDATSARSVYARSKARAEQVVRELLPDHHLILRTSWVYGPDPQEKNFLYKVRRTLAAGDKLAVPADQHGQPTYGPDLARTARELVARGARGTFHVVGPQYLSRLAWGRMIAEHLSLPQRLLRGRKTAELPTAAYRPLAIRLERRKLCTFLGRDPIRAPQHALFELARDGCRQPARC